jgi:hypothetical protein
VSKNFWNEGNRFPKNDQEAEKYFLKNIFLKLFSRREKQEFREGFGMVN